MSKPTKTENFGREHPLGLNILERGCILHMYFHLPFKIPGTSFHPLLPIGICSPLIICHLEKLCLNSLCICPLLSVYLWCLNMVLDIRAALHRSTETFPSPKMFQYPLSQNAYTKWTHYYQDFAIRMSSYMHHTDTQTQTHTYTHTLSLQRFGCW